MSVQSPWRLVTVNTAPERAQKLIGRVADALKDRYDIQHVANCASIDEVKPTVTELQPNLLFCASMWTPEQSDEIQRIARSIIPDIKTYAIPQGLQVREGPDAIVAHLIEQVPKVIDIQDS